MMRMRPWAQPSAGRFSRHSSVGGLCFRLEGWPVGGLGRVGCEEEGELVLDVCVGSECVSLVKRVVESVELIIDV